MLQWVRRDFIVRYRQSGLGLLWALLQPALLLTVYGIVFVKILHVRSPHGSYLVFAYCGLAPWTFMANAVTWGSQSFSTATSIIKQVYFPRSVVPLAAGGVIVLDLLISTIVLLFLQLVTAGGIHLSTLALIPLFVGFVFFVEGLVVFSSVLGALVRDIRFVIPLALQVGFIITPVMYPRSQVGTGSWSWVFSINPFAQVISGVRSAVVYGQWPSLVLIVVLLVGGATFLALSVQYLNSVEDRLPDLL